MNNVVPGSPWGDWRMFSFFFSLSSDSLEKVKVVMIVQRHCRAILTISPRNILIRCGKVHDVVMDDGNN